MPARMHRYASAVWVVCTWLPAKASSWTVISQPILRSFCPSVAVQAVARGCRSLITGCHSRLRSREVCRWAMASVTSLPHHLVTWTDGQKGVRLSTAGGIGTLNGAVFASRKLDQSFAVVKVGDYRNVKVYA